MSSVSVCFTNFGPYHLARLRALAARLAARGDRLIAYEVAGTERTYPWSRSRRDEAFEWVTLFPDRILETIEPDACRQAMVDALEYDWPDVLGIVGYARPESMAAACWAAQRRRAAILLSESQEIDRPRVWWKEMIKRRRVRLFDAAVVGGPAHRDYLIRLGMPPGCIAMGYNAVDNAYFAEEARRWRDEPDGRRGLPRRPYFLSVCRFVPDKNLERLVEAFARYRRTLAGDRPWDLVLCGDGPGRDEVEAAVAASGIAQDVHRPGFLQVDELPRWYAHAGAFVLSSLHEPWGLVANEAAASGLPLVISRRAGCASTLVPDPPGTTGISFDPLDVNELAGALGAIASSTIETLAAMGRRAAEVVSCWGPERFADGVVEAVEFAGAHRRKRRGASILVAARTR